MDRFKGILLPLVPELIRIAPDVTQKINRIQKGAAPGGGSHEKRSRVQTIEVGGEGGVAAGWEKGVRSDVRIHEPDVGVHPQDRTPGLLQCASNCDDLAPGGGSRGIERFAMADKPVAPATSIAFPLGSGPFPNGSHRLIKQHHHG